MIPEIKMVVETAYGTAPPNYPEPLIHITAKDIIMSDSDTRIDAKFRFECPCCKTAYWFEVSNDETEL